MTSSGSRGQREVELKQDLHTVLQAGNELPPQMSDAVIDAFVAKLEAYIDARLDEKLPATAPTTGQARHGHDAGNVSAILGVGIPFVVLAGVFGHEAGAILAVLVIGGLAMLRMFRETISP